jgi:hypothetical protein
MTPMPRFAVAARSGIAKCPGSDGLGLLWHASCIVLLHGCLYVAPVWRPEVNQQPQVTVPADPEQQQLLKIVSEQATLVVAANDPEDEIVSFVWQVPNGVHHEVSEWQNDNGDYVSTLTVDRHDSLNGSVISCTLSDQAKPRNVVNIEWLVEVL